jgi:outer membrane protein assembly factor BamB
MAFLLEGQKLHNQGKQKANQNTKTEPRVVLRVRARAPALRERTTRAATCNTTNALHPHHPNLAGGVVAFSLSGGRLYSPLWSAHLDLTTDTTPFRAYVYSPPTLADADGDGRLDVILGTSVGFLYVLDGRDGTSKPGWPRQMGPVESQVLAADVNSDGKLELVAADTLGNVAAFDAATGAEVWERFLGEGAPAAGAPVAGDIDGDGELEVVVAATDGTVYVLRGEDGKDKPGFPYRCAGNLAAQPTILALDQDDYGGDELPGGGAAAGAAHMRSASGGGGGSSSSNAPGLVASLLAGLHLRRRSAPPPQEQQQASGPHQRRPQQHIAIAGLDGLLYLIGGRTGCASLLDLGEPVASSVLADDLFGDGTLGLAVATLGGSVFGLATRAPYHPLKSWPAQAQGSTNSGLVARWGWLGVSASPSSRAPRDVAGRDAILEVDLVDARPVRARPRVQAYNVTALYKGVGVREMNAGASPVIGVADALPFPGRHAVRVPTPRSRCTAVLAVELTDQFGLKYDDEFALSFHVHFHRLLKWVVALPLLGMSAAILLLTGGWEGAGEGDSFFADAQRPEQRDVLRGLLSGGGGGGDGGWLGIGR